MFGKSFIALDLFLIDLNDYEAIDEMKAYSKLLGIKILDPIKYYLKGVASEIEYLR